jgi:Family of unknown function (DUF5343)
MRYGVESSKKLKNFLETVRDKPRPSQSASIKWLKGYGFTSSKDNQFLHILETLGFVDGNRNPVTRWKDFQTKEKSKQVMAQAILEGYSVLYKRYPDAHKQSADALERVFIVEKSLTERRATEAVRTFNTLLEFAGFDALDTPTSPTPETLSPKEPSPVTPTGQPLMTIQPEQLGALIQQKRELGVNINIQVTLPETTEAKVYESIFAALKKHFFSE